MQINVSFDVDNVEYNCDVEYCLDQDFNVRTYSFIAYNDGHILKDMCIIGKLDVLLYDFIK